MTTMEKLFKDIMNGVRDDEFGQNGFNYITDTTVTTGNWKCVKCITACVFTTLTASVGDNGDAIALAAGDIIYGPFTAITLASGSVVAYNRNKV